MKENLLGIDIGGTKCAVIYGIKQGDQVDIVDKVKFPTTHVDETIEHLLEETKTMMQKHKLDSSNTHAIGICCGGPLNSETGVVQSPPNLPGWDKIPIVSMVEKAIGIHACLHNDANACALAEWKFGAGRGTKNMVFLSFGTGLGAGLVLNGKLYTGTNDNAGEVGHIRLADFGPVGYGKQGSFEGFASGGGIAQLAQATLMEHMQMRESVSWCNREEVRQVDALQVAQAAHAGDALAQTIYDTSATYLGKGLSIIIDVLNPEVIVIGGIYSRNHEMMRPVMEKIIKREALQGAADVCEIRPAELGEQIGDYAALTVAATLLD